MKLAAALLLASTFVLSAARAAELPTREARPNPDAARARTCVIDGQRGVMLPGSDTCMRVTGSVSAAVSVSAPTH